MNADELRDALLAAGGNILEADLGTPNIGRLLQAFGLPALVGPVSVDGDTVVVEGQLLGVDARAEFEIDGDGVGVQITLALRGNLVDLVERFLPDHTLPLPTAFGTESVVFACATDGRRLLGLEFTGTLDAVAFEARLALILGDGEPALEMAGSATCQVQGRDATFSVAAELQPNGLVISGSMEGTLDFGDFQLSDVGLAIGVDLEGVPSLGLSATLNVDNVDASVAVFFDSVDPASSLVSGAVSPLSLAEVVGFLGGVVLPAELAEPLSLVRIEGTRGFLLPASTAESLGTRDLAAVSQAFARHGHRLPDKARELLLVAAEDGGQWFLTDRTDMTHYRLRSTPEGVQVELEPQLRIVPTASRIGVLQFDEGVRLEGAFRLFFLRVENRIDISRGKGALVMAAMEPIVFLSQRFASITALDDPSRGPTLDIATFHDDQASSPELAAPHCVITGQAHLLGLSAGVRVSITTSGLEYALQSTGLVSYELSCKVSRNNGLDAGGTISVGGQHFSLGPLGEVDIPMVSVSLAVSWHDGIAVARASFSFDIGSIHLNPTVELSVDASPLVDLLAFIRDQVMAIARLLDPRQWAGQVLAGVIACATAVGTVLADVYQQTADQAAEVMQQVGYDVHFVAGTLRDTYNITEQAAAALLTGVGYGVEEVANAVGVTALQAATALGEGVIHAAHGAQDLGLQAATATGEGVIAAASKVGKLFSG